MASQLSPGSACPAATSDCRQKWSTRDLESPPLAGPPKLEPAQQVAGETCVLSLSGSIPERTGLSQPARLLSCGVDRGTWSWRFITNVTFTADDSWALIVQAALKYSTVFPDVLSSISTHSVLR